MSDEEKFWKMNGRDLKREQKSDFFGNCRKQKRTFSAQHFVALEAAVSAMSKHQRTILCQYLP